MSNLISRDDAIKAINDNVSTIAEKTFYDCLLYRIPAVDAVPVVHGKWIHRGMDIAEHPWRCSVCSWGNHHIDRYVSEFERCPGCGAIMDVNKTQI